MSPPPSLAIMENVKAERNKKARDKTKKKKQLKEAASAVLVPATTSVAVSHNNNTPTALHVLANNKAENKDQGIGEEGNI